MNKSNLLDIIKQKNINNIKDVISLNSYSESTVRRNLKHLEDAGFLKINYGGIITILDERNISVGDEYKKDINISEKRRLGKLCSDLIEDGDVIFIDNGTTVRFILEHLKEKDVEIYTNGYNHIDTAKKYNLNLNIIPGNILYKEAAIVGEESLAFLSYYNFDKVFIGANGFSQEEGVTTPNKTEMVLKRQVLKQANKSYIVVGNHKFNKISKYKICSFEEYPIITFKSTKK